MRDYTPPSVDARVILRSPVHFIAFGFGTGLSPRGPGTVGTLAGLPFWFLLNHLQLSEYLVVCAGLFCFGCWICGESAKRLGVHDHGGIVFDEIVGFLVACTPLLVLDRWTDRSQMPWLLLAAFLLFRLLDIWKPWPIRALDDKVNGGLGIMIDDLMAGLLAALLILVIWVHLPFLGS